MTGCSAWAKQSGPCRSFSTASNPCLIERGCSAYSDAAHERSRRRCARACESRGLDLSIGKRLTLGFGALLAVTLIFAVAVYVWHSQSVAAQRTFTDEIAPLTDRVDSLERSLLYVGISLRSYLLSPDPKRLANYRSYAERVASRARAGCERCRAPAGRTRHQRALEIRACLSGDHGFARRENASPAP